MRQSVDRWGNVVALTDPRSTAWATTYRYDAGNRLVQQVQTDADGRAGTGNADAPVTTLTYDKLGRQLTVRDANGHVNATVYDAAGQLAEERHADGAVVRHAYDAFGDRVASIDANRRATRFLSDKLGRLVTTYRASHDAYTWGPTGLVLAYNGESLQAQTQTWDSAGRLLSRTNTAGETTRYAYDANGHLSRTTDVLQQTFPTFRSHSFVNDANGQALYASYGDERNPGAPPANAQRQLIVNGEVLGRYGDESTQRFGNLLGPQFEAKSEFGFGYQPIDGNYPAGSPGTYAVAAGDTLKGIAKQAYGDEGLWYVIADANGLSSSADLRSGQVLTIPNRVASANNEETFKPYDPTAIQGDLSPTAMAVPGDGAGGCGGVGQIVVLAIAVVVAFYVGPLATSFFDGAFGAGAAATFAGGATAAAAGSVASQAAGVAIGTQDQFSWKQVALSAVSGGIDAGLGGIPTTGNAIADAAIRQAAGNVLTQGVAVATGLQSSFNWRSVAASAVGGATGAAVGPVIGEAFSQAFGSNEISAFGARLATGLVAGAATAVTRGGRVSVQQVATDAFGNALGDSLTRSSLSGGSPQMQGAGPWSDTDYRNGSDLQSDIYGDEGYRQRHIAHMQTQAGSTSATAYVLNGVSTTAALPVEVRSSITGNYGDLPSMYPAAQLVGSGVEPGGSRYFDYDVGSRATAVREQRVWAATPLGPLPASSAPVSVQESDRQFYNDRIASADSAAGAIGYTYLRALNAAGHDIANGAIGLYKLATDANARTHLVESGINAITHPIDSATALYNASANYVANTDGAQMAEDALRLTAGGLPTAGTGKIATSVGGLAVDGIAATGRWLGPVAGETAERYLIRTGGLAYAVEPGVSGTGATSAIVEAEAAALRRIAINNQAPSPAAELRKAYQQARGQIDFAHIEADVQLNANGELSKAQGGHFSTSPMVDIVAGTEQVGANGVIYGKVNLLGPDGNFYLKSNNQGFSSMTPDTWSVARAKGEMSQAWLGRALNPKGEWTGMSGGVEFRFHAPNDRVPQWRGYPVQR